LPLVKQEPIMPNLIECIDAETIRRELFGPRCKGDQFRFRWHTRGWDYPRWTYELIYSPPHRFFALGIRFIRSRRGSWEDFRGPVSADTVDAFQAALPPELLARCMAASIYDPRDQS
jgi:hypothetical protein